MTVRSYPHLVLEDTLRISPVPHHELNWRRVPLCFKAHLGPGCCLLQHVLEHVLAGPAAGARTSARNVGARRRSCRPVSQSLSMKSSRRNAAFVSSWGKGGAALVLHELLAAGFFSTVFLVPFAGAGSVHFMARRPQIKRADEVPLSTQELRNAWPKTFASEHALCTSIHLYYIRSSWSRATETHPNSPRTCS